MENKRLQWAKEELERYIKNADRDWQDAVECAKIALTAIKELDKKTLQLYDSMWFLVELLDRLQKGRPLTPIEDKDFFDQKGMVQEDPRYLKEMELKSNLQCKRMLGLFRKEHLNGIVDYTDTNRVRGIDLEHPDIDFYSNEATEWVDRLFPITMPYFPMNEVRYKVFFKDNEPKYIITPNNKRVDIYK